MSTGIRFAAAAMIAIIVGLGMMTYDRMRGAEWTVPPNPIGTQTRPGTVTMRPIRSETVDLLPFKWALSDLFAGALVLFATRRRA